MRRFIQLLKILFSDDIHTAVEHYNHPELVKYYDDLKTMGLSQDELEVLERIKFLCPKNLLIYGAGTGRESKVFSEYVSMITAYEPVKSMLEYSYQAKEISYVAEKKYLQGQFDCIFVTRNLPSFLLKNERLQFYSELKKRLADKGVVFIYPDIMELSYIDSFRYKLASNLLKLRSSRFYQEEGDTLRVNLDHFIGDDKFVSYHYFPNDWSFVEELRACGFEATKLSLGFFQLKSF